MEEALWPALKDLVLGREVAGKPRRRSRKRARKRVNNPNRMHDKTPKDWDTLFQRLVEYREKHGNCMVSKNFTEDAEVSLCLMMESFTILVFPFVMRNYCLSQHNYLA